MRIVRTSILYLDINALFFPCLRFGSPVDIYLHIGMRLELIYNFFVATFYVPTYIVLFCIGGRRRGISFRLTSRGSRILLGLHAAEVLVESCLHLTQNDFRT